MNPLETFISTLAACETSTMRILANKLKIDLGVINYTRIESNYDLGHWANNGGKDNKLNDIFVEV